MATVNKHQSSSLLAMLLFGAVFLSVAGVGSTRASVAGSAGVKAEVSMAAGYFDEEEKSPLCDGDYEAEVIELDIEKQKLGDFVRHLNEKYGANIALDPELGDITFSMSKVRGKWLTLLKIIMEQNRLKKECKEGVARIRRKK